MRSSLITYIWRMAWRNVWRARRRSFSAWLTLTCGLVAAIATYGLARGISRQMVSSVVGLRLGHLQVHATEAAFDLPLAATFPLPDTPPPPELGWTAAPRIHTAGLLSVHRPMRARLAPLSGRPALLAGRAPERPCEVVASGAPAEVVGLSLLHTEARDCPQLTIAGVLASPVSSLVGLRLHSATLVHEDFLPEPEPEPEPDDSELDALEKLSPDTPSREGPGPPTPPPRRNPVGPETLLTFTATRHLPVKVFAVSPAAEARFALARSVHRGRWLPEDDGPVEEAELADVPLVIGEALARRLDARLGERLGLDAFDAGGAPRDAWGRVVGVFETQLPELDAQAVFVPLAWATLHLGFSGPDGRPRVHELAILLERPGGLGAARAHLARTLPAGLVLRTWRQLAPGMRSAISFQEGLVFMILSIVILMAMLGTLNSFLMSILERTWEFGVLKAVGLGPGALFSMIVLEALIVGTAAVATGGALGAWLCSHLSTHGLDLSFLFADGFTFAGVLLTPVWHAELVWQTVAIPVALLWSAALAAALWPAWRVARMTARAALSEEK